MLSAPWCMPAPGCAGQIWPLEPKALHVCPVTSENWSTLVALRGR